MIDPGLTRKVVLLTGTNNPFGIGAAIARAFAAQGSRLLLHSYSRPKREPHLAPETPPVFPGESFYNLQQTASTDELLAALHASGAEACAAEADFADSTTISALFDQAEMLLGPVDILVNNAAAWEADTFLPAESQTSNRFVELWTGRPSAIGADSFQRLFAVNALAPALLMHEFAVRHSRRKADWGRIINISTDGASSGPSEASYAASKSALESYTRSAATELGKLGIAVNALALGPVQTGWITPELEHAILPATPLGRIGAPEEVADVVVFLASTQARWITGQRIYVGGGHAM